MKPQKQRFKHDPDNGIWGDCGRTAIAVCLGIDRDDVPHFFDKTLFEDGNAEKERWLNERGWSEISIPFDADPEDVFSMMQRLNPNGVYRMCAKSRTGVNHVVVCCGDKIVCDPSLTDAGIIGRSDDGYVWVEMLAPVYKQVEAA